MKLLSTIAPGSNVVVFGASGGIGRSLCKLLAAHDTVETVFALSRSGADSVGEKCQTIAFDLLDEASIVNAAEQISKQAKPVLFLSIF